MREAAKDNPEALDMFSKTYPFPFEIVDLEDEDNEKPFLLCRYNRQGDLYRSPWTNLLHPGSSKEDNNTEPDEIRLFESTMNHVWDSYKSLYYGHDAVGSVYLEPYEKGSFQGFLGIQKNCDSGSWSSMHIITVETPDEGSKTCIYKVETTCLTLVNPSIQGKDSGTSMDISARLTKEVTKICKIQMSTIYSSHIENIGKMVEANEIDLRSNLERVHIPKAQEIVDGIQKVEEEKQHRPTVNPLMGMIMQSDVLKKKLAKETSGADTISTTTSPAAEIQKATGGKPSRPPPGGVNPLMGMIMESDVLKKKLAKEAAASVPGG